jgi:hypothetical protein
LNKGAYARGSKKTLPDNLQILKPNNYLLSLVFLVHMVKVICCMMELSITMVVILAHHASGVRGHSGITTTLYKVRALFSKPNMKHGIETCVSQL